MAWNKPDHRELIAAVVGAVRRACDPAALVERHLDESPQRAALSNAGAAVGKAALGMASAVENRLGGWVGPIVLPRGSLPENDPRVVRGGITLAGHPLPDMESRTAASRVMRQLSLQSNQDAGVRGLLVLLSGGASALMIDPPPEISVEDYARVVKALLRAGATIQQLNAVRKHIDGVKGGRLAQRAARVPIEVLVLSDVPGDDLSVIGSGPMTPDPTTYADAWDVLLKHGCTDVAPSVSAWIQAGTRGEHAETPKPGDPAFDRVHHATIGSNATAIEAASRAIADVGVAVVATRERVEGEAALVGRELAVAAAPLTGHGRPQAIVWGGETTVTVGSASGKGGRNQELALAAAIEIDGKPGIAIATFATDGVDGPTDAAGAIVTGQSCDQARRLGLDPRAALQNHDSYSLFDALDRAGYPHLIRTGPTGTNVNDLAIALAY